MTSKQLTAERTEPLMRKCYDGRYEANETKMVQCFTPDAVHSFPSRYVQRSLRWRREDCGALEIRCGEFRLVLDYRCVADRRAEGRSVIEWTHFKTKQGAVLRRAEWVVFDRDPGLFKEIRAYYVSPQATDLERLELGGFDYAGRGYSLTSPRKIE
jgi:methyltransferase